MLRRKKGQKKCPMEIWSKLLMFGTHFRHYGESGLFIYNTSCAIKLACTMYVMFLGSGLYGQLPYKNHILESLQPECNYSSLNCD